MMHAAAFWQSVDPAGVYVQLAAPIDPAITTATPRIQVPTLNQIIAASGGAESTIVPRIRLVAPSLLTMARDQVMPLNFAAAAAVVPLSPLRVADLRDTPLILVPSEQLTCELLSDPAAAQIQWMFVLFADKVPTPLVGKSFTCRATVANALVAGTWTPNTLVFDDQLPRGRYAVVGLRGISTSQICARLLIPGQPFRPGSMSGLLVTDIGHDMFRYGNLGSWGEFEDVDNLTVETLANLADTAASQIYYVDLVQLRAGPG